MALDPDHLPASLIMDTQSSHQLEADPDWDDDEDDDLDWDDGNDWPDAQGIIYKQIPDWDATNTYWQESAKKILEFIRKW